MDEFETVFVWIVTYHLICGWRTEIGLFIAIVMLFSLYMNKKFNTNVDVDDAYEALEKYVECEQQRAAVYTKLIKNFLKNFIPDQ
jgi:hypothetical protein